jgi:hypothetical protein
MHPVNNRNFGPTGIQVSYNNGTAVVVGWIVKQLGTRKFTVTSDGVTLYSVFLAKTTAYAQTPGAGFCTIIITTTPNGGPEYVKAIYDATVVTTANNKYPWSLGSAPSGGVVLPNAPAPITNLQITSPIAGEAILTFTGPTPAPVGYLVQYKDVTGAGSIQTISPTPTSSPVTKTGLTSTNVYTFYVSSMGTSGSSPVVSHNITISMVM